MVPRFFRESEHRRQQVREGWFGYWRGGPRANSNGEQFAAAAAALFLLGITTFLPGLWLAIWIDNLIALPWPIVRGILFAPWVYLLYVFLCRYIFEPEEPSRLSRLALSAPAEVGIFGISVGLSYVVQSVL
ncbi:hypothetical protein [Isoptericola aurantiacus]|uniref:hypothetical protein n=1 Tax=Isoptericola aurantiacus TaxID=3377839 RepID=UPI00383A02A2